MFSMARAATSAASTPNDLVLNRICGREQSSGCAQLPLPVHTLAYGTGTVVLVAVQAGKAAQAGCFFGDRSMRRIQAAASRQQQRPSAPW